MLLGLHQEPEGGEGMELRNVPEKGDKVWVKSEDGRNAKRGTVVSVRVLVRVDHGEGSLGPKECPLERIVNSIQDA